MHESISQKHTDLNHSKNQLSDLLCPSVAKGRVSIFGAHSADGIPTLLHGAHHFPPWVGGRDEPRWPAPTSTWPLLGGLGGGTYVEFFILCDDFRIGQDGGRRAFGERISWKTEADESV